MDVKTGSTAVESDGGVVAGDHYFLWLQCCLFVFAFGFVNDLLVLCAVFFLELDSLERKADPSNNRTLS